MKQHRIALFAALIAAAIATPAFASSSPPTATSAQVLVANYAIDAGIKAKLDIRTADATYLGATTVIAKTTSGPPGWSAIAKTRDILGDNMPKKSTIGLTPRPADATTAEVKALLSTAAPPNGFAREDLLAAGMSIASSMSIGSA